MRCAAREAARIRNAISSNTVHTFKLVLDYRCTGDTYGDCIYLLGIARHIIANGRDVHMYIANTDHLRVGISQYHSADAIDPFLEEIFDIVALALSSERCTISEINQTELSAIAQPKPNEYLVLAKFVRQGRFLIGECFNVLNCLMSESSTSVQNSTLFSPEEFSNHRPSAYPTEPYITWGCRYPLVPDDFRHTTPTEFAKIYTYLKVRFPNHQIVVVSDAPGCKHYQAVARGLEIDDLSFSKEFTNSFLEDSALIMYSSFFFWHRAGGIDVIPRHSRIPFEMLGHTGHEIMWNELLLSSWQGDDQTFINIGVLGPKSDRQEDLCYLDRSNQ